MRTFCMWYFLPFLSLKSFLECTWNFTKAPSSFHSLVLLESVAGTAHQWFNRIWPSLFPAYLEQCQSLLGLYFWHLGSLLVCIIKTPKLLISHTHRRPFISDTKFDTSAWKRRPRLSSIYYFLCMNCLLSSTFSWKQCSLFLNITLHSVDQATLAVLQTPKYLS